MCGASLSLYQFHAQLCMYIVVHNQANGYHCYAIKHGLFPPPKLPPVRPLTFHSASAMPADLNVWHIGRGPPAKFHVFEHHLYEMLFGCYTPFSNKATFSWPTFRSLLTNASVTSSGQPPWHPASRHYVAPWRNTWWAAGSLRDRAYWRHSGAGRTPCNSPVSGSYCHQTWPRGNPWTQWAFQRGNTSNWRFSIAMSHYQTVLTVNNAAELIDHERDSDE